MAEQTKSTVFGNSLIWFGAAVSIAEILTGISFAPLGYGKGIAAIVIGHLLGCAFLYYAGLIGAKYGKTAMEATKLTFGPHGGELFAGLNVLQLIGWTAVMIASGAQAAQSVFPFACGTWLWSVIIGLLILIWILAGIGVLQKINIVAMVLLFGLSLVLSKLVFQPSQAAAPEGSLSFGVALELSIAMPISWLPLIADYTSNAGKPKLTCMVSALVYFIVSCWMYVIGMAAAIYAGSDADIAAIMTKAGLPVAALLIVILSTVTTTFLDVYSAGISTESIESSCPGKISASIVCVIGVLLAIFSPTNSFESFLLWIGSVFVPMATVHIMDLLVLKHNTEQSGMGTHTLILWAAGFIIYRVFLALNLPVGSTIPDVLLTALLCWIASLCKKK